MLKNTSNCYILKRQAKFIDPFFIFVIIKINFNQILLFFALNVQKDHRKIFIFKIKSTSTIKKIKGVDFQSVGMTAKVFCLPFYSQKSTCMVAPQSTSKPFLLETVSNLTENINECSLSETCSTFFTK